MTKHFTAVQFYGRILEMKTKKKGLNIDLTVGQYEIKGRNMADRENQLWELLQYNSNYKLESLTYEKVSPLNCIISEITN